MARECALFYSDNIKGLNAKEGDRKDSSAVIEFKHEVYRPVDGQKGSVEDTRVHKAAELILELDTAAPPLIQACTRGDKFKEFKVEWYRLNEDVTPAKEEVYFSHTMTGVRVVSTEIVLPNTKDDDTDGLPHHLRVQLQYDSIKWLHHIGNIPAQDAWKQS